MTTQLQHPQSDEQHCRSPAHNGARHDDSDAQRNRNRGADRECMTEREWAECSPHRPPISMLHAQGNREKPAHSGVEAVEGA
jgi:hypothetical protein